MKKISIIFFSFFLLFQSTGNTYNSDPELFIKELVEDAISKLSDENINDEEKAEFIGKIALENVDIEALSLYTLGEIRKSTEKSILVKYKNTFEYKVTVHPEAHEAVRCDLSESSRQVGGRLRVEGTK